jgi:toxin ParE2
VGGLKVRGLGGKFLGRVTEALNHIQSYPESCPVLLGRARRKPLKQFPYSVVYSIDPSGIFVLAVAHQKRRVDYWRNRF